MTGGSESSRRAAFRLMYSAIIEARMIGWTGAQTKGISPDESKRLADLMDIVHNLPSLLQHWQDFNEDWLIADLQKYDKTWNRKLLEIYQRERSNAAKASEGQD